MTHKKRLALCITTFLIGNDKVLDASSIFSASVSSTLPKNSSICHLSRPENLMAIRGCVKTDRHHQNPTQPDFLINNSYTSQLDSGLIAVSYTRENWHVRHLPLLKKLVNVLGKLLQNHTEVHRFIGETKRNECSSYHSTKQPSFREVVFTNETPPRRQRPHEDHTAKLEIKEALNSNNPANLQFKTDLIPVVNTQDDWYVRNISLLQGLNHTLRQLLKNQGAVNSVRSDAKDQEQTFSQIVFPSSFMKERGGNDSSAFQSPFAAPPQSKQRIIPTPYAEPIATVGGNRLDLLASEENVTDSDTVRQKTKEEKKVGPQIEIKRLAKKIRFHDQLYYQQDLPKISDADYDALRTKYRELIKKYPHLIPSDDPEQNVGAQGIKKFPKVKHLRPLYSLDKANNPQEILDFDKRIHGLLKLEITAPIEYVSELKIDGLSGSLRYFNGRLVSAATRGNGVEGEDVTANVLTIPDVPHQILFPNEEIEVRGEFYLSKADFLMLNQNRQLINEQLFANPRNAAAGILRNQNHRVTTKQPLRFFAYELIASTSMKTHEETLVLLKKLGFEVNPNRKLCKTIRECEAFYNTIALKRALLPYDIDGVVYKVNDLDFQRRLGYVSRYPLFAIAHKFKAEQAITRLNAITVQVSRTGKLTPVAELEPVNVGGTIISRAMLYNEDEINRKTLAIGDSVLVQRAGDVIPQVVKSLIHHSQFPLYQLPSNCPVCGSKTERMKGSTARRCTGGVRCGAQILSRLKHFVSKKAFDINGLGRKNLGFLFSTGRIIMPPDIFTLQDRNGVECPLLENERDWGDISVRNLFATIQSAKSIDLDRLIYALGIPCVGAGTAKLLAKKYSSWENFFTVFRNHELASATSRSKPKIRSIVIKNTTSFFHKLDQTLWVQRLVNHLTIKPYSAKSKKLFRTKKKSCINGENKRRAHKKEKIFFHKIMNRKNVSVANYRGKQSRNV